MAARQETLSQLHQLEDNLAAIQMKLTAEELTELDAVTTLPPMYPNWLIDRLVDEPLQKALG